MYHDLTKRFNDLLKLKQSPVGLAFVDDVPVEVSHTIPGSEFAMLVERLETITAANAALAPFHQQQKARFSA